MTDIVDRLDGMTRSGWRYLDRREDDGYHCAITDASDEILSLRSSLNAIREENDRLKGEIERLESLHRSEIADMAERFRSVNLSAALDLMPDNSALVVRAERAESSCEAMAKALEPFAKLTSVMDGQKHRLFLQLLVCPSGDDHPENYGPHLRDAHSALAEYRKEEGE
jgi:hypothetical protein